MAVLLESAVKTRCNTDKSVLVEFSVILKSRPQFDGPTAKSVSLESSRSRWMLNVRGPLRRSTIDAEHFPRDFIQGQDTFSRSSP